MKHEFVTAAGVAMLAALALAVRAAAPRRPKCALATRTRSILLADSNARRTEPSVAARRERCGAPEA
jgi:hypothetical protein